MTPKSKLWDVAKLTPWPRQVTDEMVLQGALRWREQLSCDPYYVAKAKRDEELTGDSLSFYKTLFASRPFMLTLPSAASTPQV